MREIPEKDWKIARKLKDELLQRFCNEALKKIKLLIKNQGDDSHKAYLDLWEIMTQKDKELSSIFDDLKRSTAFFKIATWKSKGLLTDTEFNQFSDQTMAIVKALNSL